MTSTSAQATPSPSWHTGPAEALLTSPSLNCVDLARAPSHNGLLHTLRPSQTQEPDMASRTRVAFIGASWRAIYAYASPLLRRFSETHEIVGIFDISPRRIEVMNKYSKRRSPPSRTSTTSSRAPAPTWSSSPPPTPPMSTTSRRPSPTTSIRSPRSPSASTPISAGAFGAPRPPSHTSRPSPATTTATPPTCSRPGRSSTAAASAGSGRSSSRNSSTASTAPATSGAGTAAWTSPAACWSTKPRTASISSTGASAPGHAAPSPRRP